MAMVTDATLSMIKDEVAKRNEYWRNFALLYTNATWDTIQANVRSGRGAEMYPVGTELVCNYTYNGETYSFPWIIVENNRTFTTEGGMVSPGLVLQAKYATIETLPFDAAEREEATEETAQEGFYYCGYKSPSYRMLNLEPGDPIPYESYTRIYKGSINNYNVYSYGYNRWSMSAVRQWLNSDGDVGEWWTASHPGDSAPSQLETYAGFMRGLDDDFLAVVQPVHIKTVCNNVVDGGVTEDTTDKFWLASVEEMYGVPQPNVVGIEGDYFTYWKETMGVSNPTNSTNNARKVRALESPASTTAYNVYTRSCSLSYTQTNWFNKAGQMTTGNASQAMRVHPVCVIC